MGAESGAAAKMIKYNSPVRTHRHRTRFVRGRSLILQIYRVGSGMNGCAKRDRLKSAKTLFVPMPRCPVIVSTGSRGSNQQSIEQIDVLIQFQDRRACVCVSIVTPIMSYINLIIRTVIRF